MTKGEVSEAAWPVQPLDSLTHGDSTITYGVVKPGEEDPDGVTFIRGGDIVGGRILEDQLRTITPAISQQYSRTLLRGGELLVSLVGNPGQVALVPESLGGANIARQVGLVRLNESMDRRFVMYYLLSHEGQAALGSHSLGSVQKVINLRDLKLVPVPVPPLPEQRAIAGVLGSLDDKIEQNRRTAAKLEALARATFRAWFVDFAPVHAKAAGATSYPGLPPIAFDALPTTFQESPLGLIPEGWEVKAATDIAKVAIGKTPPRKESHWFSVSPNDVRWVSIANMKDCGVFITDTTEYLTEEAIIRNRVRRIPDRSVLFSFKLTVGRVAITDGEMTSNEAIAHFVPKQPDRCGAEYLFCYLASFDSVQLGSTSSIATATNSKAVKAMPILDPQSRLAMHFTQAIRPQFNLIRQLQRESRQLAALRDYLLPRLLSGAVRVGEGSVVKD